MSPKILAGFDFSGDRCRKKEGSEEDGKMRSWEKDGGWKSGSLEGNNLPGTIIALFPAT